MNKRSHGRGPYEVHGLYGLDLECSFCGKSKEQVKHLIAGPRVYICDGCIYLAAAIIIAEEDAGGSE